MVPVLDREVAEGSPVATAGHCPDMVADKALALEVVDRLDKVDSLADMEPAVAA
jgi:hypothetical protein